MTARRALEEAVLRGYTVDYDGTPYRPSGEEQKTCIQSGYATFSLSPWGNVPVHRLAAATYFGLDALKPGEHVRHLNNDKLNNSILNLALGTPKENAADRHRDAWGSLPGDSRADDFAVRVGQSRMYFGSNLDEALQACIKDQGENLSDISLHRYIGTVDVRSRSIVTQSGTDPRTKRVD